MSEQFTLEGAPDLHQGKFSTCFTVTFVHMIAQSTTFGKQTIYQHLHIQTIDYQAASIIEKQNKDLTTTVSLHCCSNNYMQHDKLFFCSSELG